MNDVEVAARASWRKDLLGVIRWRVAELERLGATLRTSVYAEADDVTTDLDALLAVDTQPGRAGDGFELHRVGDAISSRNVHTAVLDALRLCIAA